MRTALVQRAALAITCLALLTGCRDEVYLVPHGYTGPVVVVFECPAGELIDTGSRVVTFPIGSDGILLVDGDSPPDGWVDWQVCWIDSAGGRTKLPTNRLQADGEAIHAFGLSVGFTRTATGEKFSHTTFWIAAPTEDLGQGEVVDTLMEEAHRRCRP